MHDDSFDEQGVFAKAFALYQAGQLADAADLFNEVLSRNPQHPDAVHLLGLTAYQFGQIDAAEALVTQATQLRQPFPDALANLGSIYRAQGRPEAAETALKHAIDVSSPQAPLYFNLGNVLIDQHKFEEAVGAYKQAVKLDPNHGHAWNGLGGSLRQLGLFDQANTALERAVELCPDHHKIWFNVGNIRRDRGDLDGAEAALRQAIALKPDYASAWNTLGNTLGDMARAEEALEAFETASRDEPDSHAFASNVLIGMQYVPGITAKDLKDKHIEWMWLHAQDAVTDHEPLSVTKGLEKPLRLGFLSTDLGQHPVGFFLAGLLPELKNTSLQSVCLSTRPPAQDDYLSEMLKAAADEWHDCSEIKKKALADYVRSAEIDILFDLAGHTGGNQLRVFAMKPAPVQVSWLGYVGTTGLATIDYLLADLHHAPPGCEADYAENILRMPHGYALYTPPPKLPDVGPLPALTAGHVTFGCFNHPSKLSKSCISRFAAVLQAVPKSCLRLQFRGLDTPSVHKRLVEAFANHGISPDRIDVFGGASHYAFLDAYNEVDIALDTTPYSGGLTTCEALWMGVPVLTCPGDTFASRHSTSHMTTAGLPEFVARDETSLIQIAKRMANDLDHLSELRTGLRAKAEASPLGNAAQFATDFETVMRGAWRTYCETPD